MDIKISAIADIPHTCVGVIIFVKYPEINSPTTAPTVPALDRRELTEVRAMKESL